VTEIRIEIRDWPPLSSSTIGRNYLLTQFYCYLARNASGVL
jgi:hypothetical protein